MRIMSTTIATLLIAFGSAALTLAAEPVEVVPANAVIYYGWDGMDNLGAPLAQTGMMKILSEPAIAQIGEQVWTMLLGMSQSFIGPELTHAGLTILETLSRSPGALALIDVEIGERGPLPFLYMCIDSGAATTATLEQIDHLGTLGLEAMEPLQDGDTSWRRLAIPEAPFALVYGAVGDRLVIALGEHTARRVAAHLREKQPNIGSNERFIAGQKAIEGTTYDHFFIDVKALIERAISFFSEIGQPLPPIVPTILEKTGLDKVEGISASTAVYKQGFRRTIRVGIEGGPKKLPPMSDADLELIPRDTSFAMVVPFDLTMWFDMALDVATAAIPNGGEQIAQQRQQIEEALGFNVRDDLLQSMGTRAILYEEPSMRTFLPNMTVVLQPKDAMKLQSCVSRLMQMAASLVPPDSDWGVQLHTTKADGLEITQVVLTGWPIPIAPAWAAHGDRLYIAMNAASIQEAVHRQKTKGRDGSLLAHKGFQKARAELPKTAHGLSYSDTTSMVRGMYPIAAYFLQMASSWLGGQNPELQQTLLPSPSKVESHVFPDVGVEVLTDDAYMTVSYGPFPIAITDVLVMSASAGFLAGLLVPTVNMTRQRAQRTSDLNNARILLIWCQTYADDKRGRFPKTLDDLHKWNPEDVPLELIAGFEIVPGLRYSSSSDKVLLYQKHTPGLEMVAVAFVGGHCRSMPPEELRKLLGEQ